MTLSTLNELTRKTWDFGIENGARMLSIASLPIGLCVLTGTILPFVREHDFITLAIVATTGMIASLIVFMSFTTEAYRIIDNTFSEIDFSSRILPCAVALLLYTLMSIAGLTLIIPGVVWSVWYGFAPIIIALENISILQSFKQSHHLVRGIFWPSAIRIGWIFLVFWLVPVCVFLIFAFSVGIDNFVVMDRVMTLPRLAASFTENIVQIGILLFTTIAYVIFYSELKKNKETKPSA